MLRLFTPKAAVKALDAVTDGLDSAIYTPQEKAEMRLKQLKAVEPFKVVQRILMGAIALVWVLLILQYCAAIWIGAEEIKKALLELVAMEFVWGPTLAGFALYLGGGLRSKPD